MGFVLILQGVTIEEILSAEEIRRYFSFLNNLETKTMVRGRLWMSEEVSPTASQIWTRGSPVGGVV